MFSFARADFRLNVKARGGRILQERIVDIVFLVVVEARKSVGVLMKRRHSLKHGRKAQGNFFVSAGALVAY